MALISPPTDRVFKFNFGSAPPIERDYSIRRSTQDGETQYELLDARGEALATAEQDIPIEIVIDGDLIFSGARLFFQVGTERWQIYLFVGADQQNALAVCRRPNSAPGDFGVCGSTSNPVSVCPADDSTDRYLLTFPIGDRLSACNILRLSSSVLEILDPEGTPILTADVADETVDGLRFFLASDGPPSSFKILLVEDPDQQWTVGLFSALDGPLPNQAVFGGESDGTLGGGG